MPENVETLLNESSITEEDLVKDSSDSNGNKKDSPEQHAETKEEASPEKKDAAPSTPKYDIKDFKLTKILSNNIVRKSIALLGKFPNLSEEDEAIVLFEKKAFKESDVQTELAEDTQDEDSSLNSSYFNDDLEVQTEFINNIYGSYQCIPKADLNTIKASVVYPATGKHIQKYSICQKYLIKETPNLYTKITLPYIESSQFSLEWVYNILEHKQEVERIVFEDNDPENGFILLPDMKWDGRTVESLYLLIIPHKRDIKSIRDLTGAHLPLLKNIEKKSAEVIEERYGLNSRQLRMYFHYQPSFYHLHVHINQIKNDAPGIWCEKSHMLGNVINNLELLPDYYQKATIPFVLFEGDKLLTLYEKEMIIRKSLKRKANTEEDGEQSVVQAKLPRTDNKKANEKQVE